MKNELRFYSFGNMYLSSIQQGIQAAHVVGEMSTMYWGEQSEYAHSFYDWAANHKTIILLNGGYGENLHDLIDFFDCMDNEYPFAYFKESEAALDNALTSVGIVLPEEIYGGAKELQRVKRQRRDDPARMAFEEDTLLTVNDVEYQYSAFQVELMERLSKFRLAI